MDDFSLHLSTDETTGSIYLYLLVTNLLCGIGRHAGMPPVCLDTPYVWMLHMFGHLSTYFGCPLYVLIMFGCLLYIDNTKKVCFIRLRGCPYAPYIWSPLYVWTPPVCSDGLHMFGHPPHMFGCPCMFGYPPYVWIHYICLDAPCMFGYLPWAWTPHMFGYPPVCFDAVWMPAVHIQHKESMLFQTKWCPYAPYI